MCFFSRPCNRELFATFSTCQQIVYIALFSDSHTFTSLVQCQTTCLFRDVHYSPLDNVYRWLLLLPKHKLNQHENKWKNNETFNITLRIFAWSTKHESHPDDVSLLQFITDSNNVVHRFTVQCHLMFEIAIHAKQKKTHRVHLIVGFSDTYNTERWMKFDIKWCNGFFMIISSMSLTRLMPFLGYITDSGYILSTQVHNLLCEKAAGWISLRNGVAIIKLR